ncbi:MAG: Bug family tripartite tricarboxylate transporter substrate binding protein [Burkholderiales bacterium]
MKRFLAVCGALALALSGGTPVLAQSYPDKPVRLVVPYPPGGTADLLARLIGQALGDGLKQPIVVENRGGAGGNIAADYVARSPADGYTLLFGNVAVFSINPTLYKKIPFNPIKDFAPVSLVASVPQMLVVHPSMSVSSVKELVNLARSKPGELNYASGGIGSATQLAVELVKTTAGVNIVHVPFKGSGPALAALAGGQVSMMIENVPTALPFVRDGRLRALAITTAKRSSLVANLPTLAESGFPGYDLSAWFGVQAPAGTPPPIVARLNHEIVAAVQSPQLKERFASLGADPVTNTPEEFAVFIKNELEKWAVIVKQSGATAN